MMLAMQQRSHHVDQRGFVNDGSHLPGASEPATEPLHLTHQQVDELYNLLETLIAALDELHIEYVMIGGSLLGAVRCESILFNDDQIEMAVLGGLASYDRLRQRLPELLLGASEKRNEREGLDVSYECQWRPWTGCDRIKSSVTPQVSVNVFVLRRYESVSELSSVLRKQSEEPGRMDNVLSAIDGEEFPLYHYDTAEVMMLRPNEFFRSTELLPTKPLSFGHLRVKGPQNGIGTLRRFFGEQCFTHYAINVDRKALRPGERCWQGPEQDLLSDEHFRPIQHSVPEKQIWTDHTRRSLEDTLSAYDQEGKRSSTSQTVSPSSSSSGKLMSRTRSLFTIKSGSETVDKLSYQDFTPVAPKHGLEYAKATEPLPTKWFGRDVRTFLSDDAEAPNFEPALRAVMEPHVAKARKKREESRNTLNVQVEESLANAVGVPYTALRDERRFLFDEHSYPIHRVLAETLGVSDLSLIHEHPIKDKRLLLDPLLHPSSRRRFHECYDNFVTSFCIPLLHSLAIPKNLFHTTSPHASSKIVYRYQAFPCIRIVRPGEFSIGPHCDIAYGHSIGNLNFHIPLTPVFGTNALYTESHPGREDWHPLTTKSVGLGYLFDGARCIHFALENTTNVSRVSIDFRIAIYRKRGTSAPFDGGLCTKLILEDRFWREGSGYYDEAIIDLGVGSNNFAAATNVAKKVGNKLYDPDARNGFPFTTTK